MPFVTSENAPLISRVLDVWQIRNEDAVFCRSSMSSSTTPFWKHVSAVTPPFLPVSYDPFITTWTDWTRRPTPAPLKRSSGWDFYQTSKLAIYFHKMYKTGSKNAFFSYFTSRANWSWGILSGSSKCFLLILAIQNQIVSIKTVKWALQQFVG